MFQTVVLSLGAIAVSASLDLYLDKLVHYDFTQASIYMLPVGFAAWAGGSILGAAAAFIAATLGLMISHYIGGRSDNALVISFALEFTTLSVGSFLMARLRYLHEEEKSLSRTDQLTGLSNSRAFWETMELEIERMKRDPKPMTVMFIDVDDFKRVNDAYGHREGDRMLKLIATSLLEATRSVDAVARLGGDEFVALLPGADAAAGRLVAERLKYALDHASTHPAVRPTISIGLATFRTPPDTTEMLLHAADMLMYEAKTSGKNKSVTRVY